ncbi:MAG: nucleotidyltransferase family protein [Lachnospiraceae bacterium]|nr:nucleotidyltransferase family protein [Lachnospiraceae bacterium]
MKTAAVIAEFNPFHNGHLALLRRAKDNTGADFIVVVMSGDFVQRGEPAVMEKFTRARAALMNGADLVLELPLYYSLGSAEYFARGAVTLLNRLSCIDTLVFGSECGDIAPLEKLARILADEPPAFQVHLQEYLKEGDDFPTARTKALALCLPEEEKKLSELLTQPNNLLGVEYLRQMYGSKSRFHAVTFRRTAGVSASAIRSSLLAPHTRIRRAMLPETCAMLLTDYETGSGYRFADPDTLFPALTHLLMLEDAKGVAHIADVGEDIANRLYKVLPQAHDLASLTALLHTKDLTEARVRRALLHILLHIPQKQYDTCVKKPAMYARVLGFRKNASAVMNHIKAAGKIPLISKLAQSTTLLQDDPHALRLLSEDIRASRIYDRFYTTPAAYPLKSEYEKQVLILS